MAVPLLPAVGSSKRTPVLTTSRITGHEHKVVHQGGGCEKAVNRRDGIGHIQATPAVGYRRIDQQDAIGEVGHLLPIT